MAETVSVVSRLAKTLRSAGCVGSVMVGGNGADARKDMANAASELPRLL